MFKRIDERIAVTAYNVFVRDTTSNECEPVQVASDSSSDLFYQNDTVAFKVYFQNNGTSRKVPKGYLFPRIGLCNLICSWFCSDQSKKISPLSLIPRSHLDKNPTRLVFKDEVNDEFGGGSRKMGGLQKKAGQYLGNYFVEKHYTVR